MVSVLLCLMFVSTIGTQSYLPLAQADGIRTHVARQCPFSALFALFVLTCVSKPAPQKTKIAQKLSTVGCKAVLPELIFVQARQSPQRILDVFARVLMRHELNPTGQNRHGFKSRQPKQRHPRQQVTKYTA